MFSPSELEGEVDHSFFDSDCDDSGKDGGKRLEKAGKEMLLPVPEKLPAGQSLGRLSPRTEGAQFQLKKAEKSITSGAEKKEDCCGIPSTACTSNKVLSNGGNVDKVSSLDSKRLNETFLVALAADSREVDDEDGYHQSQNESEEEEAHTGLKGRNASTPKKLVRKRHPRSPSPSSTDTSDTDSSSVCSDRSYSSDPPALTRPKTSLPSSFLGVRRGRAGSRDWPPNRPEESEDTVTDVTPLSTPDISPVISLQSLDMTGPGVMEAEDGSLKEQQQESVPSSGLSSTLQVDQDSDQDVDGDCSLASESQVGGELAFVCHGGRNRKNYSFSNDEVRRIDRENQRLLQELSRPASRSRPGSMMAGGKRHTANNSPLVRLYHSGLNRQREQQRIERENLAFLKRLESIKPTPGMRRSDQLADYQRQARYTGASSYPVLRPTSKAERLSSRTPSGVGPRLAAADHHSSRAASASATPAPRSAKVSVPPARPAWC